jgi:hypothetical protein
MLIKLLFSGTMEETSAWLSNIWRCVVMLLLWYNARQRTALALDLFFIFPVDGPCKMGRILCEKIVGNLTAARLCN